MLHTGVIREIRVANRRADFQSTIRHWFNLVERQAIDVEYTCGCLDVQFHEVDQRCSAAHKSHLRALLRRLRLCGGGDGSCGIFWRILALASSASCSGSLTPASNASSIARAEE